MLPKRLLSHSSFSYDEFVLTYPTIVRGSVDERLRPQLWSSPVSNTMIPLLSFNSSGPSSSLLYKRRMERRNYKTHPRGFHMPIEHTSVWRRGSFRRRFSCVSTKLNPRLCLNHIVLEGAKQRCGEIDYWSQTLYARANSELESKIYSEWKTEKLQKRIGWRNKNFCSLHFVLKKQLCWQ